MFYCKKLLVLFSKIMGRSMFVMASVSFISALILTAVSFTEQAMAQEMAKCQDGEGNWHYGDFAAAECANNSEITNMSETGTVIGTVAAPPTKEELAAEKKQKKEAQEMAKKKQKQEEYDQSIVQIYGSEEVILSTRDRKLASIDNNLDVTRQLKQGILADIEVLKQKKQSKKVKTQIEERVKAIVSYDEVIQQSLFERGKLENKYTEILEVFRSASSRLESGN